MSDDKERSVPYLELQSALRPHFGVGRSLTVALLLVVCLATLAPPAAAIPAHISNRMVPSWWQYAKTVCYSQDDCEQNECCGRPMLSSRAYCMPMKTRSAACDATPYMLDYANKVHFGDCPCESHLTCATVENVPQCVDRHSLELDFRRYGEQPGGYVVNTRQY